MIEIDYSTDDNNIMIEIDYYDNNVMIEYVW